jgi:hypothetical protein
LIPGRHGEKFMNQNIRVCTRLALDGGRHHRRRRFADRA